MEMKDILNLIAIIVIPIVAVLIGQWLQNRSEKRKDKMQIFKALMTARIYGWTVESVHALNVIDIVFADDTNVINAWKKLHEKYIVKDPTDAQLEQIKKAQDKLLEEISNSLGYNNKITWETIQTPYIPDGMVNAINRQQAIQSGQEKLATAMELFMQMVGQNASSQTQGANQEDKQ